MNRYGARAQEHWRKHRAQSYAQLEDPERFFTELGEQISTQVQVVRSSLEAAEHSTWASMDYLSRVGRLNAIRLQAEELAFAELVWPTQSLEENLDDTAQTSQTAPEVVVSEDGSPMPADRQHPLWSLWEASLSTDTKASTAAFDEAYRVWLREHPDLLV